MRLQRRSEALETGKEAITRYIDAANQCELKVKETIDEVVGMIWEYGRATLSRLAELKEAIGLSIEEADSSLYEDYPYLKEQFSAWLLAYDESTSAQLFTYKICTEELSSSLASLCTYHIHTHERHFQHQIACLHEKCVYLLDASTGNQSQIELCISIDHQARYCALTPSSLLSIRGKTAYLINTSSGETCLLPGVFTDHQCPGVISTLHGEGYVFGGETQHCERLKTDLNWVNLTDMSVARRSFSPCMHQLPPRSIQFE